MPLWTDLPNAFRGSGLSVIEYQGWQSRGHGTPGPLEGVVCHHTAGPPTGDTPSLNTVVYGRSDLPGPLCNLYLSRSGVVYIIASGIGYHAGNTVVGWGDNNSGCGIEAEATGVDPWPKQQYDAYSRMCACLASYYRLPIDHVAGHKEVCDPPGRKIDPNFDMNAFRTTVKSGGAAPQKKYILGEQENEMLIFFDNVMTDPGSPATEDPHVEHHAPAVPPTYEYRFHGQRTCEAGGGSNIASSAWACFSSAWGGCNVSIAALDGKGGVKWIFGQAGKPSRVDNNKQIPFPLPSGTRVVTIEGTRDNIGTIPACDVYNLP